MLHPRTLEGDADRYDHRAGNDGFTQAGNLYRVLPADERDRLHKAIAGAMAGVPREIVERQLGHFDKADPADGAGVRAALGGQRDGNAGDPALRVVPRQRRPRWVPALIFGPGGGAMSEAWFSDNFSDLSVQGGVDAGFRFEFYCERCRDAFRTEFEPYRSAQAAGFLGRASGLLGGLLGSAGDAVETMAQAGWNKAHDAAFARAIESARQHFHRCARCSNYFCARCFNPANGLCRECAPDAEVEIEAARAQGEVYAAGEKAALEGIHRGKQMDVKRDRQLVCPECGAETRGAKFCPECGHKLAVKGECPACHTEIEAGVRFCPECGTKLGQ